MEKSARTRFSTVLVLAVVFGAGAVLGFALGHGNSEGVAALAASDSVAASQSADSAGRHRRPPLYMQVDPTPEQKVKLDSILKEYRDSMQVLTHQFHQDYDPRYDSLRATYHRKYDPRMQALFTKARNSIRAVLTPEQVVRYDSILDNARHDDSVRVQTDRSRHFGERGAGRDGGRQDRD